MNYLYSNILFFLSFLIFLNSCVGTKCGDIAWGKTDKLIDCYESLIKMDPSDPRNYFEIAWIKKRLEDDTSAIEYCNTAIQLNPFEPKYYYLRASLKENINDYDGAIEDYTKIVDLNPNDSDAYDRRGHLKWHEKNDIEGAIEDYTKAINSKPESYSTYYSRAIARYVAYDYTGSIADLNFLIGQNIHWVDIYNLRGNVKLSTGDYSGAIEDYTTAIDIDPDKPICYYNRGKAYELLQYFDRAIRDYKKALNLDPNHKYANDNLENLLAVLNNNPEYLKKSQLKLKDLGYYSGDIDGDYSKETKNAIIEFQKDNQINTTGEIDSDSEALIAKSHDESVNKNNFDLSLKDGFKVNFPPDGYETKEFSLPLDFIFNGNSEIERITVKINNQKLKNLLEPDFNQNRTVANIDSNIPLSEGKNDINLLVFTSDKMFKKKITVIKKREILTSEKHGKKWAVVIGIENYNDKNMTDLDFTVDDAEDFTRMLIEQGKFSSKNIILIKDRVQNIIPDVDRKEPTFNNIKRALFTTLRKNTSKNDLVIIYYSGHGILVPDSTSPFGRTAYIAPIDFEFDAPEVKGIRLDEIKRLAYLAPERMFLIIDSCFSGGGDENVKTIAGYRMKAGTPSDLTKGFAGKGRVLMASSLDNQVSLEAESLRNSVFTYYLVEILGKGERRLSEIFNYVHGKVLTHTNGNQEPRLDTLEQKGKIFLY